MNNNSWHKKEKPLLGLLGTGGGVAGDSASGGPITATGGTKATPGDGYIYHWFTSSGSLVISAGGGPNYEMDVLMVGGGGGGTGGSPGPGTPGTNGGSGGGGGYGSNEPAGTCPDPTYGNPGKLCVNVSPTMYAMGGGGGGAGSGASPTVANPYPYQGPVSFPTPGPQTPWHNASDGKTLPWIPTAYGEDGNFAGGGAGGGGNGAGWGSNTPAAQKAGAGRGSAPTVQGDGAHANTGSGGGGGSGGTSPENPSQVGHDGAAGAMLFRYAVGT